MLGIIAIKGPSILYHKPRGHFFVVEISTLPLLSWTIFIQKKYCLYGAWTTAKQTPPPLKCPRDLWMVPKWVNGSKVLLF